MTMNHYLRYALISGLFLVPFIVFIVPSNMFFPFITGKNFAFRVVVEILLALYLVLALRVPEYRPRFSWLLGVFAAFIAIMGLATLFSEFPAKSFWSNYERMEGYVTFLHLFAYFVVAGAVLSSEKLWERLFQVSLGVNAALCLYAILQWAGRLAVHQGGSRLDASLGNSTYFAIYLVIHIFLALFLLIKHYDKIGYKIFYGAMIFIDLLILYQTETRGAILGFVGGILLTALIIALFERDDRKVRKIATGAVAGIAVLILIFIAVKDTEFIRSSPTLDRLAQISITDATTNPRIPIWSLAYEGFKDRPILGWGQESFNYVFNSKYDPRLYPQEQWFDRTHNVVLDWLIAGGVLGFAGYMSLYLLAMFYVWRKGEFTFKERAVLTGMFAAYFFHNLFVFDNLISLILFGTFLAYLHSHAVRAKAPITERVLPGAVQYGALPVGLILAVLLIYCLNWAGFRANTTLIQALVSSKQGLHEQSLTFFKKALAYDSFGNQEIREQLMQYSISIRSATNVPDALKQEVFTLTLAEMEKAIAEAPNDTRHRLFFGTVLDAYGQTAEAEKQLDEAVRTSPKKQTVLFQLGTHHLNSGDRNKALEIFKTAYELEPNYNEARLIYAMGAIYSGNQKLADELIGEDIILDDRLLRAYIDTKQLDKAGKIVEERIRQNPTDTNLRLALASLYFQAGQKNEAIKIIRQLIAEDPSFKDQGESYIKEIQGSN